MERNLEHSPAILFSSAIAEICKPLHYLNVTHFNYRRTYADGARALLTNDPKWLTHYYREGYADCRTFESIDHIQSEHVLWKALEKNSTFAKIFADARTNFNIDHGLTIIKKHLQYVEFFHFGTTRDNYAIANMCWENTELLEKFILYFRDQAAKLIDSTTETKFYSPTKPILLKADHDILPTTITQRYLFNHAVLLSRQESLCLFFYLRGRTLKQIAEIMLLSSRTLEEYINNIKKKIGLNTKYDLFKLADKFVLVDTLQVDRQKKMVVDSISNFSMDAVDYFNQLPIKKYFLPTNNGDICLSKRQAQCLFNVIQGKTNKEIARLLNLSTRTIEDNLHAVKQKLSCCNKNDLIATLFDQQLITEIKHWHFI